MIRAALGAEVYLQLRRRVSAGTAVAMAALASALVALRLGRSRPGTEAAIRAAELEAAELTRTFGDVTTPAQTYVEPRYVFAAQFPHDLAGVLIGLAVLAFIGGALLCGGDWRTRVAATTGGRRAARSTLSVVRVLVWAGCSMVVAVLTAVGLTAAMLAVAATRGSISGVDLVGVLYLVARGGLVVLLGALCGASLGVLFRSDVAVVVVLLAYVLIVETLVPVLTGGQLRTPAAVVHAFLRSEDPSRTSTFVCDVPRCSDPVLVGPGDWAGYGVIVAGVAVMILAAWCGARRPVWR